MSRTYEIVFEPPKRAWLVDEAHIATDIDVVGETGRGYRIWVRHRTRIGARLLKPGDTAMVPKTAVQWVAPRSRRSAAR